MRKKGVIVGVGDSLFCGVNSVYTEGESSSAPFGNDGQDTVFVYDRWLAELPTDKIGTTDAAAPFGWSSLPYRTSNWTNDGPCPMYYVANAIHRFLDLDELRVIMMGTPSTDVVQSPPSGNVTVSWYPGIDPNGSYDRFETKYINEALATGNITSSHVYLGAFASLGNNMNNAAVYTTDETGDLQENLNVLFSSIEGALLAPGDTGRQVVTRIPASVRAIVPTVSLDRIRTCHAELSSWKGEAFDGSNLRATAWLGNVPFIGEDNPHFTAENTMVMGQRMFKAWLSAAQSAESDPNMA